MTFSCKKDLGNYDYTNTEVPLIDTTKIPATYNIPRYATLKIVPGIKYAAADTGRLTYQWIIYKIIQGTSQEIPVPQEIAKTRVLNTSIGNPIGPYTLELIVTDPQNGLKSNIRFTVNVNPNNSIGYGMMVLHTNGTTSDVDFLITKNAVPMVAANQWIKNIYSQAQGQPIYGEPRFIASSRRLPTENWVTIGTSTHITRVSGVDFTLLRENLALFLLQPNLKINPQAFVLSNTSNFDILINDKKTHFINSTDPLGNTFPAATTGSYSLAPFIAEATSSSMVAAVYDDQKLKFIHPISSNIMAEFRAPAATTQPFDLTNIGKTMIGMDRGASNYTLSFFKDVTGSGRWLYVTNFSKASDDGLLAVGKYDMTTLPDIANATIFSASESGNVIYYATAHDVYLYNYTSTQGVVYKGYTFPTSETITSMKIFKPKPTTNLTATVGLFMYVATWDGNLGRVYEFEINPSGGETLPILKNKFEGFGRVVDMAAKGGG